MKKSKRAKIVGCLLLLAALCFSIGRVCYTSPKPLSVRDLDGLIAKGALVRAKVVPTIFHSVYEIQGTFKNATGKIQSFNVTTHLDEARLQQLTAMKDVAIDMPRQGSRAQRINIISTLFIAGLVGFVVLHQVRLGNTKTSHKIRTRPNVRFDDVAGIEEAKAEVQEVVDTHGFQHEDRSGQILPLDFGNGRRQHLGLEVCLCI